MIVQVSQEIAIHKKYHYSCTVRWNKNIITLNENMPDHAFEPVIKIVEFGTRRNSWDFLVSLAWTQSDYYHTILYYILFLEISMKLL